MKTSLCNDPIASIWTLSKLKRVVRGTTTGESCSWSTVGKLKKKLHDNDDGHPDEKKKTPKKSVVNSVAAGKPRGRKPTAKKRTANTTKKEDKGPHQGKYYEETRKDFPEGIARHHNVPINHKNDNKPFLRILRSDSLAVRLRELCLPLAKYDHIRCANCKNPITWNSAAKHACHPASDFTVEVVDIPFIVPARDPGDQVVRRTSRRLAEQGLGPDSGSGGKD